MSVLREKKREKKRNRKKDEGDGSEGIEERKVKIKKRLNRVAVYYTVWYSMTKSIWWGHRLACNKGHHFTHRKRHTGSWKSQHTE